MQLIVLKASRKIHAATSNKQSDATGCSLTVHDIRRNFPTVRTYRLVQLSLGNSILLPATSTRIQNKPRQFDRPMLNGMAALLHEDTTPQFG